jgi:predicted Zn-dependent protease with MMP-like domain
MQRPSTPRGAFFATLASLIAAVGLITLVVGYSPNSAVRALQVLTVLGLGAAVIGGAIMLALVHLADWHAPEEDFEMIVRRAERLAAEQEWDDGEDYGWDEDSDALEYGDEEEFQALVHEAVDELPLEFHRTLEHVALVIADSSARVRVGRGRRAVYGMFEGDTTTHDYFHDRVVIFRDALIRDFGHDPELLREQISRTVQRELSRHIGSDTRSTS